MTEDQTLNDLLRHAGWVRAVAHSLVRDAATAEDLVQDTWVAALRSGKSEPDRPWLATVLRNAWRQRRRRERRRERRESFVASSGEELLPSASELAERVERQRELAAAVRELPEPFRAAMILRYYEDLSAAEIARRCDEPADRVRWRLKRGRELLRERLERRYGTGWVGWCMSLVPLNERSAAPLTATTTLAVGVMAMSLKTVTAAVVSIAALVGVAMWSTSVADGEPVIESRDMTVLARDGARERPVDVGEPERASVPSAPALSAAAARALGLSNTMHARVGALVGTVIAAESGVALGGVEVALFRNPESEDRRTTTTDDRGRFEFVEVEPNKYQLGFLHGLRSPKLVRGVELEAGTTREVEVELRSGFGCRVAVSAAITGEPVRGARVMFVAGDRSSVSSSSAEGVKFRSRLALTDAVGVARLRAVPPGPQQIVVQAEGFSTWLGAMTTHDRDSALEVELELGAVVTGRVARADGLPIAGTRVYLEPRRFTKFLRVYEFAENEVEVDAAGNYRIANVPAGRHYAVALARDGATAFHQRGDELSTIRVENGGETRLDLEIAAPVPVRLRVTDAGARPIVGARASVSWGDFKPPRAGFFSIYRVPGAKRSTEHSCVSDADGRLEMPGVRVSYEPLTIRIQAQGYRDLELEVDTRFGDPIERDVVMTRLGQTVRGRLSFVRGAEYTKLVVGAWELHGGKRGDLLLGEVAPDGAYEIALPDGVTHFEVFPALHDYHPFVSVPERRRGVIAGSEGVDFELAPKCSLEGVLVDEHDVPLRDFHAFVRDARTLEFDRRRDVDLGEGRFRVSFDPDLHDAILFTAPGFAPDSVENLQPGGTARVVLRRTPPLRGRVVDQSGLSVVGAVVCLATLGSDEFPLHAEHSPCATTNAEGEFVLDGIAEMTAGHLLVRPNRHDAPRLLRYRLMELDRERAVLRLPKARRVSIEIVDPEGQPLSGQIVIIDSEGWPVEPRAEVALRGAEAVEDVLMLRDGATSVWLQDGRYAVCYVRGSEDLVPFALTVGDEVADARFVVR